MAMGIDQLESQNSIFSNDMFMAVHAVSTYQPELAYKCLAKTLTHEFKLSKKLYENDNYPLILGTLEELATCSEYFEFSAITLLTLAAREVKLGIYHGSYEAIHRLTNLFKNACSRTRLALEHRKNYLDQFITQAGSKHDYYQLYVLVKVLGIAANVFESGEHEYFEDPYFEKYIHFAIEIMMRYAGVDDEDGLCLTAEEELHKILETTSNEPETYGASDIPFLIFRLFLKYDREWNVNPFYHLEELEKFIDFCKKDKDDSVEHIKMLELRQNN
jgi:hypothetical protein